MAKNSVIEYTGDGSTIQYTINFTGGYTSEDHVYCQVNNEVDGSGDPVYRTLTFISEGLVNIGGTVPGLGEPIEFKRITPVDTPVVDFEDGVVFTEGDIDAGFQQVLFGVQEAQDNFEDAAATEAAKIAAEAAQVAAEAAQTAAELAETNAAAYLVLTNADVVSTNADAVSTAADAVATGLDAASTAADASVTNADVVTTNADVVSAEAAKVAAELAETNAATSEANAGISETNAAASALAASAYDPASFVKLDGSDAMSGNLDLNGNDLVGVGSVNGGPMGGYRNKIINGDFDIAQRATSHAITSSGIYVTDRWHLNLGSGASLTMSQEEFTLGDDTIPSVPKHYIRLDRSVAGSSSSSLTQKIEGLAQFSGKTITQTFWARASSAMSLFSFFQKNYGTSGSPTSPANIYNAVFSITTSWQKFTRTLVVDDLTGDTLGTDGNDCLEVLFSWNTSNNAVGQLEIAHVSVVEGDATAEADPFTYRAYVEELALCQRFYSTNYLHWHTAVAPTPIYREVYIRNPVQMRTQPAIIITGTHTTSGMPVSAHNISNNGLTMRSDGAGAYTPPDHFVDVILDAEL